MLYITNQQVHREISFDDYQSLPGYSHSMIRMEGKAAFTPTAKMNVGTNVHNYLLTPKEYNHSDVSIIRPIAMELKGVIGNLWERLETELAVTADFNHGEFYLPYKGRIDAGIIKKVVIDFKIINGNSVRDTLDLFHYDTQLSGYALGIAAEHAFIIAYSRKTKKVEVVPVKVDAGWWSMQTTIKGKIKL